MRRKTGGALIGLVVVMTLGLGAAPAVAHPLGNATVNHYDGLEVYTDHLEDHAVEDIAEIPTYQRKGRIDTDHNGALSDPERSRYATSQCAQMAKGIDAKLGKDVLTFTVSSSSYVERPGAISLKNGRLECELRATAALSGQQVLAFSNLWDDDGIGWHEITAIGSGTSLQNSPFPAKSISDSLRKYPNDLLSSPLNVRSGSLGVSPGGGFSSYQLTKHLPVAGPAVRALNQLASAFNNVVGRDHLTVGVGLLAVLLSLLLGAGHAFLPGHGKTIMAAYLVGRRGRLRDVFTVGATVTITHTAGVLILGLLIASTSAFAPTAAEQLLGVLSGLVVAAVGIGLLVSALRARRTPRLATALSPAPALVGAGAPVEHSHDHPHEDEHHDHHDHEHHDHEHHDHAPHKHGFFGKAHSHAPTEKKDGFSRGGLVGLGIAGGMVPSPSALLVLLAATALGRTWFGIVLVLGYGVGMALALCAAGLLLVRLRGRLERLTSSTRLVRADRVLAALPILTALLVLSVGVLLALRAAGGTV